MRILVHRIVVLLGIMWMLAGCGNLTSPRPSPRGEGGACRTLVLVDSLMWQQPDSAFALLQTFAASPEADSLDGFEGHYFQLLVSELLYKNDCQQTNRKDLLRAVVYFDSLTLSLNDKNRSRRPHRGLDPRSPNRNDELVFLTARTHYINGVGYYERDSVMEACAEYIKTLETMEERFEENELIGHRARFMSYTYNRLGDLFYGQFMSESAIVCYKQAFHYCKTESTSKYGIPVLLYNIGIQFDVSGLKDSAEFYYNEALASIPDYDNIHYRDILTSKALLAYNSGHCVDSVVSVLKYVVSLASNDDEKLTRFLTLGNILFEDGQYDSSLIYLQTVFEQQEDVPSRVTAAQNLCSVYKMKGDTVITPIYSSFLASFAMTEFEKKKEISKMNEMLQVYLYQKQKKQAEDTREKAIRRIIEIIVPIALAVLVLSKIKSRKLLKEQQEKADRRHGEAKQRHEEEMRRKQAQAEKMLEDKERSHRQEMEAARQSHKMQQAALSGRLKRSNEELRDVSNQLEQILAKNAISESGLSDNYNAFVDAPVCLYIVGMVNKQQFKSKMNHLVYKDNALNRDQLLALRNAAKQNLPRFISTIHKQHPSLTDNDMDYCYLILLGLNEAGISALLQKAYTTVCDRCRKIGRIIGATGSLFHTLHNMLSNMSSDC